MNHVPSKSLTMQLQPMNCYEIPHLANSPYKQSEKPGAPPKVLPTGRISLHHCLQSCPREGLQCHSRPHQLCLHIMQNHLETRPASSLPLSPDHREFPMKLYMQVGEREDSRARLGTLDIGPLLQVTYFRACSGLILYISFPFDGLSVCKPTLWVGGSEITQL